jgi:hypothetical protein
MPSALTQIVYVLTNPAMPGLVKIGKTTQLEVEERMKQLYSTGVPIPFDCAFACKVKDASEVEKALHLAFGMTRINPNREFFKLEPERVIAVLQLLKVDDITAEFERSIESDLPNADKQSSLAVKRSMRPPMNFHELGMANGSVLIAKDGLKQATVVAEKRVEFEGEVLSLTAATRKLLALAEDYAIQPSPFWTFNGITIKEIYEDFHTRQAEN